MKFNWRANWEILLVLVIIVVGILITTIAAIRNKDKHLLSIPGEESADFGSIFGSSNFNQNGLHQHLQPPTGTPASSVPGHAYNQDNNSNNNNNYQQYHHQNHRPQHQSDDGDQQHLATNNSRRALSQSARGSSPTGSRSIPTSARLIERLYEGRKSKFDEMVTRGTESEHQSTEPSRKFRLTDQHQSSDQDNEPLLDALSTEPTPSTQFYPGSGTEVHPRPNRNRSGGRQNQTVIGGQPLPEVVLDPSLAATDDDLPSDQLDYINDFHTTRSSMAGSEHISGQPHSHSAPHRASQHLQAPYGSAAPSTGNNFVLSALSGGGPTSGSDPSPDGPSASDDMMTSYTRSPNSSGSPTDPLARDFNSSSLAATSANVSSSLAGAVPTSGLNQDQLLSSAILANLLATMPPTGAQTSGNHHHHHLSQPTLSHQQNQTQRAHLGSLPLSAFLGDLLKLIRPQQGANLASSSGSVGGQQQPSILQQLKSLPGPLQSLIQAAGGSSGHTGNGRGELINSQRDPIVGQHDASESSQYYHRISVAPTDVHSILARSLRSSGVLPAFPPPKGVQMTWVSSTSGGDPSVHTQRNSNADFVATNVAGFVRTTEQQQQPHQIASSEEQSQLRAGPNIPAVASEQQQQQQQQHHHHQQQVPPVMIPAHQPTVGHMSAGSSQQVAEMPIPSQQYQQQQPIIHHQQHQNHHQPRRIEQTVPMGMMQQVVPPMNRAQGQIFNTAPNMHRLNQQGPPPQMTPTGGQQQQQPPLQVLVRSRRSARSHTFADHSDSASERDEDAMPLSVVAPDGRPMDASRSHTHPKIGHARRTKGHAVVGSSRTRKPARSRQPSVGGAPNKAVRITAETSIDAADSGLVSRLLGVASNNDEFEEDPDDDELNDSAGERKKDEADDAEFGLGHSGSPANSLESPNDTSGRPNLGHQSAASPGHPGDIHAYAAHVNQRSAQSDIDFYGHPGEETRQLKYGILGSGNYEVVNGGVYPEAEPESATAAAAVNSVANYVRKPGGLLAGTLPRLLASEHAQFIGGPAPPGARLAGFMRGDSSPSTGAPTDGHSELMGPGSSPLLELVEPARGQLLDTNLFSHLGISDSSAKSTHLDREELLPPISSQSQSTGEGGRLHKARKQLSGSIGAQHQTGNDYRPDYGDDNNNNNNNHNENTLAIDVDNDRGSYRHSFNQAKGSKSQGTNQFNSYQLLPSKKVTIFSDQDLDSAPSEVRQQAATVWFAPPP